MNQVYEGLRVEGRTRTTYLKAVPVYKIAT